MSEAEREAGIVKYDREFEMCDSQRERGRDNVQVRKQETNKNIVGLCQRDREGMPFMCDRKSRMY